MKRKVVLFIAMSLDGYIAKTDGNIDFLSEVERAGEDYGYADFLNSIDTVIWGRKTFDKVLSMTDEVPHMDKSIYVISKSRTGKHGHALYHENVVQLVEQLQKEPGKDIYCDGGSDIIAILAKHRLIDRICVSVIPHLLGGGIRLFHDDLPQQALTFRKCISYPSNLIQLWYDVEKKEHDR